MTESIPTWQSLQTAAEHAQIAAAHGQAITLYGAALAQPETPWAAVAAMRIARAVSWCMVGDFAAMDRDLIQLAEQAAARGDDAVRASVLAELVFNLRLTGDFLRLRDLGQQAVQAAAATGQPALQVSALFAQGIAQADLGVFANAQASLERAEALLTSENAHGQVRICILRGYLALRLGNHQQALGCAEAALQLARVNLWPIWEAYSLNLAAIATPDLAWHGLWLEQLLAAWTKLGDRPNQSVALTNLSIWYLACGMFERAAELAAEALEIAQSLRMDTACVYILQSLGRARGELGDLRANLTCLDAAITLAQNNSEHWMEGLLNVHRALVLLSLGETDAALDSLQRSERLAPSAPPLYTANRLACTALAHWLAGKPAKAHLAALQAVNLVKPEDLGHPDWAIEELYWYCYCALAPRTPDSPAARLPDERWQILELGRQALLAPVEKLSDAGLRRSYLHRVWYHRLLICEWLRWAPLHAEPSAVAEFAAQIQRPGRLSDIFRRLLAVGIRLNAQRDPNSLPVQIVDEVAELTGAERIALVLLDDMGQRRLVKVLLPAPPPPIIGRIEASAPEHAVFLAEIEPWLNEAAQRQQGFVRQLHSAGALCEQRSILVAPLINQNHLVGLIYCDLAGCFGRFEVEDLELLGVLANQSAVAVENANWSAMLEHKVAERTTELAHFTAALQDANAELERHVAERTAQLTVALKELERANQLKDEFMAAVSHELRTPLTGILGLADALELQVSGSLNERQLRSVQIIRESGNRLLALVDSILHYTALVGGKVSIQHEHCQLSELGAIAVRGVHTNAEAKGLTVTFGIEPTEIMLNSDAQSILQILKRLLDNAVKFTPAGGSIGLEIRGDALSASVEFTVWDTGIGIAAAQQATIFHPFVQGDGSLTRRYEGVGLGLPYVRHMVELLGGTITVVSELGHGSRFCVRLPLR